MKTRFIKQRISASFSTYHLHTFDKNREKDGSEGLEFDNHTEISINPEALL